ncbi:MAG: hypothetical protein U5L96_07980 [Owenweeksia sp.]|nr:hypothetical protein [Owenweeksia sp.]
MHDKEFRDRFVLHYGYGPIETHSWDYQNPFNIHIDENGFLVVKTLKRIDNSNWYLSSVSGQEGSPRGRVDGSTGTSQRVNISRIKAGVYVFVLFPREIKSSLKSYLRFTDVQAFPIKR